MESSPIIIERIYDVPVKKVWKALTDKTEMKKWYFDVSAFKPDVGFEFHFTGGSENKTYLHLCKITEVIPEKKLSHTWRYDGYKGNSLLTFELFPEGDKTRLKLTHSGLESFPHEPDFAKESFQKGWDYIIGISLKDFVET